MKTINVLNAWPAVAFLAAWLPLSGFGAQDVLDTLFDDPVIIRGTGILIRKSDLQDAFMAYKANLAAQGKSIPETQRQVQERLLLDRLVITQLLVGRSTEEDRAKAKEKAAKLLIDSKAIASSEEMFIRQLKALGLSIDQFNARVLEQAVAQVVVEREMRTPITITDDQVDEFYDNGTDIRVVAAENRLAELRQKPDTTPETIKAAEDRIQQLRETNLARLQQPEQVRVVHLLLATQDRASDQPLPAEQVKAKRAKIQELLQHARAGEDFSKLVAEYSEDRRAKETHGEYTFMRSAPFAPEFKAAAFSLSPGQISDVVATSYGFHIIKMLGRLPAKKVDRKEAFEEIRTFLAEQELQRQLPDYFDKLKKQAEVKVLDPKYEIPLPEDQAPLPLGS